MRIRSKVTAMAKSQSESGNITPPPLPSHPSTRTATSHTRSPSFTSSSTSPPPTPLVYPITIAAPVANPYRFAQPRPPLTTRNPVPALQSQSLSPQNDRPSRIVAKVDPTLTPLPQPHSPPTSALSFSSRSSVSYSSASHTAGSTDSRLSPVTRQAQHNGSAERLRSTLDNLVVYDSINSADDDTGDSSHDRETDGEIEDIEDPKVKAEAKSNRKVWF